MELRRRKVQRKEKKYMERENEKICKDLQEEEKSHRTSF